MPNPGAFQGSCKVFLMGEKEAYNQAVNGNYTAEVLALIYRHYFKRYPLDLPHNQEPTPEHLTAVDNNAPDLEVPEPDIFALSSEEYNAEIRKLNIRKEKIEFCKSQIKRWMAYQYMKDHHIHPKETGAQNPLRLLIAKLTGKPIDRPCRKTLVNVWRKSHRIDIEQELRDRHGINNPRNRLAMLCDEVTRHLFANLPLETRKEWELLAEQEHEVAMEQYQKDMDAPFSTDPVDQQRAIQALVSTILPILNMACEATGWKATFIAGGPEPAQGGQLNMISIHSGTTSGDVKMSFGHAECQNIKKFLIPMFGAFLQKCYTPVECRSRALPTKDAHLSLSELELDSESVNLHTLGPKKELITIPSAPSQPLSSTSTLLSKAPEATSTTRPKLRTVQVAPGVAYRVAPGTDALVLPPLPAKVASVPQTHTPVISKSTKVVKPTLNAPLQSPIGSKSAPIAVVIPAICATATETPTSAVKPTVPEKHTVVSIEAQTNVNTIDSAGAVTVSGSGDEELGSTGAAVEGISGYDQILAGEEDTLQKSIAPEEDEIEMTASRSVSPALSLVSPGPSPPPLPCRSPITVTSPIAAAPTEDFIKDADALNNPNSTPPSVNAPCDTDAIPLSNFPGLGSTLATTSSVPNQSKGRKRGPETVSVALTVCDRPAKRPTRTIIKTSKILLMEEANSRKGRKRAAMDNVEQAPVKRRRGGKRT